MTALHFLTERLKIIVRSYFPLVMTTSIPHSCSILRQEMQKFYLFMKEKLTHICIFFGIKKIPLSKCFKKEELQARWASIKICFLN